MLTGKMDLSASNCGVSVWTCAFTEPAIEAKYTYFVRNFSQPGWVPAAFFAFATASTFQYSSVFPEAIRGDFGPLIAVAFMAWICGYFSLSLSTLGEYFQRAAPLHREKFLVLRNRLADIFVILQPFVHGSLIFGRTLSPRECDPAGYAHPSRSVQSIMEEQMTCNTTWEGRIPPELTMAMGVMMLLHQYLFVHVSWTVISLHWFIGFVFLIAAHAITMSRSSFGESALILVCFLGLYLVMYSTERRRKETFQLKLQLLSTEKLSGTVSRSGYYVPGTGEIAPGADPRVSGSTPNSSSNEQTDTFDVDSGLGRMPQTHHGVLRPPSGINVPKKKNLERSEVWESASVSSLTMDDLPQAIMYGSGSGSAAGYGSAADPYDDYDQISMHSSQHEAKMGSSAGGSK